MRIPRIAIENGSFTWMVFIFLTIIGIRALMIMPRTENPEVSVPGSTIVVLLPGTSAIDMEKMVVLPVEEALSELDDIVKIVSEVRDGFAVISIEFDFNSNRDEKYDEVTRQINNIRSTLPAEILQLEVWKWSIADMA